MSIEHIKLALEAIDENQSDEELALAVMHIIWEAGVSGIPWAPLRRALIERHNANHG